MLVKINHPRRIDQFIDYFGEPRPAASGDPRPYGGALVDPRERGGGEAAPASVMTGHPFDASV
jgi:hypothetical protein